MKRFEVYRTIFDTYMVVDEYTDDWIQHHLFKFTAKIHAYWLEKTKGQRMEAMLCKQAYEDYQDTNVIVGEEYGEVICPECEGTGVFEIFPEDSQPCVMCKTSGKLWINLL